MSDLREAASGLLSAVEAAIESGDWKVDGACDPHVEIIRLKNILARPEQEPVKEPFNSKTGVKEAFNLDRGCWERGCVAYDERDGDGVNISAERVDETAKREHEPVAVWELEEDGWNTIADPDWMETLPVGTRLYTAPPKREWVGLTDEEMSELANKYKHIETGWRHDMDLIAEAEAKLKEKNSG